jgi:hypothetical protein
MLSGQKCGICVLGYRARALGEGSQFHIIGRVWLHQSRRIRPYRGARGSPSPSSAEGQKNTPNAERIEGKGQQKKGVAFILERKRSLLKPHQKCAVAETSIRVLGLLLLLCALFLL